jgi:hypothetical protein
MASSTILKLPHLDSFVGEKQLLFAADNFFSRVETAFGADPVLLFCAMTVRAFDKVQCLAEFHVGSLSHSGL